MKVLLMWAVIVSLAVSGLAFAQQPPNVSPLSPTTTSPFGVMSHWSPTGPGGPNASLYPFNPYGSVVGPAGISPTGSVSPMGVMSPISPLVGPGGVPGALGTQVGVSPVAPELMTQPLVVGQGGQVVGGSQMSSGMFTAFGGAAGLNPLSIFAAPTLLNPFSLFGTPSVVISTPAPSTATPGTVTPAPVPTPTSSGR